MNTERGIEFLESIKPGKLQVYTSLERLNIKYLRNLDEVINLLKRDKVYKQIWGDLMRALRTGTIYTLLPGNLSNLEPHIQTVRYIIENLKKKYFSKPKRSDRTVELLKELDKDVHELLKICERRMGD